MVVDVILAEAVVAHAARAVAKLQLRMIHIRAAADGALVVIAPLLLLLADGLFEVHRLGVMAIFLPPGKGVNSGPDEHQEVQQRHHRQNGPQPVADQQGLDDADDEHRDIQPRQPLDLHRDEEEQQQIFDAFRQLSNAATKDGFGLGLSIVKNLVGMMDGKIELSSKKNVGSTITVEIPLPLVHEKDIERENGIRCDTSMSMDELLAKMREKDYDILFTDLKMQGANGYDVLKILRMSNIGNSRTIPVVAVTGSAGITEDYLTGKGFSGCLSKPFSPNELMSVANRFIQKEENGKGNIDLIPLYEFGEKQRTLWLFEEETEENIRRIDKAWEKGDRHELKEILHSMRGTWELIGCGEKLNRVFSSVKNTTTTAKEIAQGICEIKRQCEDIIQAIHEEQEGGME